MINGDTTATWISDHGDPATTDVATEPLPKIQALLTQWQAADITYCHWKSNINVIEALAGEGDLDLLVAGEHFPGFVGILLNNGFKQAESVTSRQQPGVMHFLGHDESTGLLINVHAYTRILTGDHFLKSYALRAEMLLLENRDCSGPIPLPNKAAELIVFVFRYLLKHTTLLDLLLLHRETPQNLHREVAWLNGPGVLNEALASLSRHYPEIQPGEFQQAVVLLEREARLVDGLPLTLRFATTLRKYKRYTTLVQMVRTWATVLRMLYNRLWHREKHMVLRTGGKIIAFVGPPATGKTTLATSVQKWLGGELGVRRIHVGKPPSALLTWLPNRLIPLARRLFPAHKTEIVETQADRIDSAGEGDDFRYSYLFLVRKVMLAYDRRRLLRKAFRWSRNGIMVLCDRYPSDNPGAIDGISTTDTALQRESSRLKRYLMTLERRLYRDICPPDMVVQLSLSPEVALHRHTARQKPGKGEDDYVLRRHDMRRLPFFRRCQVLQVSTNQDLEMTSLQIKKELWHLL